MLLRETVEMFSRAAFLKCLIAWHGRTKPGPRWARRADLAVRCLIEQTYQGIKDHCAHFEYLLPFFRDNRYVRVEGKRCSVIYRLSIFPTDAPCSSSGRSSPRMPGFPASSWWE